MLAYLESCWENEFGGVDSSYFDWYKPLKRFELEEEYAYVSHASPKRAYQWIYDQELFI